MYSVVTVTTAIVRIHQIYLINAAAERDLDCESAGKLLPSTATISVDYWLA